VAIDLELNEQQRQLQDTANDLFGRLCPPSVVRRYETSTEDFPREVWRQMAELGWLSMSFPSEYDGLDCTFLDAYPIYIELGRHLAPVPLLEVAGVAGELVAALGSPEQKGALLPAIGGGQAIVTLAFMEPEGCYGPAGVALSARHTGDRYVLEGTKLLVSCAASADRLIVAARTSGAAGDEAGVSLFIVNPKAPGVAIERIPNIAGQPLYAVTFAGVEVPAADALGMIGGAWPALNAVMAKAAVLQSAMVLGAGERVQAMAVDYANHRVQFGEPIGKHQAVQYLCTDITLEHYVARLLTLQAAWRIDTGRTFLREASLAKAAASRAAAAMTFAAHEVHAGVGFMNDYDLQLYTRRAKHWEFNLGDYRHHLDEAMKVYAPIGFEEGAKAPARAA